VGSAYEITLKIIGEVSYMDYELMWEQLYNEVTYFIQQGVKQINPTVLRSFMNYVKEREEYRERLLKEGG